MPQFIPNQPITFNGDTQSCLNNDDTRYTMLVQGCEEIKLQIDNSPCGDDPEGNICDIDMNAEGGFIINSVFNDPAEWTAVNTNVLTGNSRAVMFYDPGSGFGTSLYRDISVVNPQAGTDGMMCKLTIEIYNLSIQPTTTLFISTFTGNPLHNTTVLDNFTPTQGVYEKYVVIDKQVTGFQVELAATVLDEYVTLGRIILEEVATCWNQQYDTEVSGLLIQSQSWSYSQVAGRGYFTANPSWDIYNTQTFPLATLTAAFNDPLTVGDTILLEYTITNCTAGSIFPKLGSNSGVTRSSDGTYSEYITATGTHDYIEFHTTQDFDGTISIVSGKVFGTCHTFDILDATDDSVYIANIEPQYVNDKIELVINPCSVIVYIGEELADIEMVSGCYKIRFNNCCDDTSTISDTVISYTTGTHPCTVLVNGTCEGRALGFDFSRNFSIQQRLRMLRFGAKYKNGGNDATGSNGQKSKTYAKSEKIYNAVFDYCDEPTHDAINAQIQCDTLTIDGVEYFAPVQDYEPDWIGPRQSRNLAQGEIELQKKQSVIFNRNDI